ncbi:MAG: hypothetical protein V4555_07505, partial [Acidobacteriota bacterium]
RAEAELRIKRLHLHERINADDVAWYRDILKAGREAKVANGIATFTIPPRRPRIGYISLTTNGVWPAAKASGLATVLPSEEIQLWDSGDAGNEINMKSFYNREEALKLAFEFSERKGISMGPGVTHHVTPDELDEMMRNTARLVEETWMLERD